MGTAVSRLPVVLATAIIGLWIVTFIAATLIDRSLESLVALANPILLLAGGFLFSAQFASLLRNKGGRDEE